MISAIIPVYNEEENVEILHRQLLKVLHGIGQPFEILFINDGSLDRTFEKLQTLRPVRIINFRKRFGQTAAFDAGFKEAKGDVLVTLDGDLQNNPEDIPTLLDALGKGYDVVCGWRHDRQDALSKRFFSFGARAIRRLLLADTLHDAGCSLRAYRRHALESLDLYGEMHRLIAPILSLRGYRVTEVKVRHRARRYGKTKYNWKRAIKGFVDMVNLWFLYKYRARPLHVFGGLGLLFFFVGFGLTAYFVFIRLFFGIALGGRVLPIGALFLVLFGIQLFMTGLLADIAIKNYYSVSADKSYFIKEIIERV